MSRSTVRSPLSPLLAALAAVLPLTAQEREPVDEAAVAILRRHGLEQSRVMEHLSFICDVHGPRLTGSPNLRRAQDWAAGRLREFGLADVRLEEWGPFGMGWELGHFAVDVVGTNPWSVLAYPKAWSPPLAGRVEGDVVLATAYTADELAALDLSDKIVLLEEPREVGEWFDGTAHRLDADELLALANGTRPTARGAPSGGRPPMDFARGFQVAAARLRFLQEKQPLAILDRGSKGDYGTLFVAGASIGAEPGTPRSERPRSWAPGTARVIPQFTIAVEHYNRVCRLLALGQPVRMALELDARFVGDASRMERNVLGELPGSDPALKDQLVMLGAHFDSWHTGTGATDNGCGSAVMIEAMRLLTELVAETGRGPRRTIRIALWSGEEQGLLGSRAWVREHVAVPGERGAPPVELRREWSRITGYFNLDNGTGRIRGIYLQGNTACEPIFRAWLRPFHDLDAATVTFGDTGGTDHQSFDQVGVPGFQFIQDPAAYSTRTHHSNMDNWDHAIAADLQQAATIVATFAWHAAQRDEMLPREELAAPVEATDRRRDG
ncbi:MAG: M28 family peptidase [Planctomycetes bacterium]|nr:M28 family peptidase [Planctomycetota bacterium]